MLNIRKIILYLFKYLKNLKANLTISVNKKIAIKKFKK